MNVTIRTMSGKSIPGYNKDMFSGTIQDVANFPKFLARLNHEVVIKPFDVGTDNEGLLIEILDDK